MQDVWGNVSLPATLRVLLLVSVDVLTMLPTTMGRTKVDLVVVVLQDVRSTASEHVKEFAKGIAFILVGMLVKHLALITVNMLAVHLVDLDVQMDARGRIQEQLIAAMDVVLTVNRIAIPTVLDGVVGRSVELIQQELASLTAGSIAWELPVLQCALTHVQYNVLLVSILAVGNVEYVLLSVLLDVLKHVILHAQYLVLTTVQRIVFTPVQKNVEVVLISATLALECVLVSVL